MDTQIKQKLFNDVLVFIRQQGVGSRKMYSYKSQRMCALGYLYSQIHGVDHLKRKVTSHICNSEQEIEMFLNNHYKEKEMGEGNFFHHLRLAHDLARASDLTFDDDETILSIFEEAMQSIAKCHNLTYNPPVQLLQFPQFINNNEEEVKLSKAA